MTSSSATRNYEWDHSDQLRAYYNQTGTSEPTVYAHYLYDAGGNRVKKLVRTQGGDYEVIVYIDGIFEYHKKISGANTYEKNELHIMDDTSRIAMKRIGTAYPDDISDAEFYVLEDHLGSSSVRLDINGTVIDMEEYYPFGDSSLRTFSYKRYRYVGKEKDSESGLYYYGARYYAAWTGRFISVDPMRNYNSDLSPFHYCSNNPIKRIDPDGRQDENSEDQGGESGQDTPKEYLIEMPKPGPEIDLNINKDWTHSRPMPKPEENNINSKVDFQVKIRSPYVLISKEGHEKAELAYYGKMIKENNWENTSAKEILDLRRASGKSTWDVKIPDEILYPILRAVIPKEGFQGFLKSDPTGCFRRCEDMAGGLGLKVSSLGDKRNIKLLDKSGNLISEEKLKSGLELINKELTQGRPVVVGVDYRPGNPAGNVDGITDHWILIVGRGQENGKGFFYFYDPQTKHPHIGASENNKLFVTNNRLQGSYSASTGDVHSYQVTIIRPTFKP